MISDDVGVERKHERKPTVRSRVGEENIDEHDAGVAEHHAGRVDREVGAVEKGGVLVVEEQEGGAAERRS